MEVTMKLSQSEKRKLAMERLLNQLASGRKPRKNGHSFTEYEPEDIIYEDKKPVAIRLNKNDIARINGEIEKLKTRI